VCTLVCYKESKLTHLISVVSPKFFAIMPRGKQFDVGVKTTIMTLFTEGVAPMPNTNQNCVLISAKVVRRRFQVPPPKSNEKPVFCISQLVTQRQKKIWNFFLKIMKAEAFLNILL
jgi:hypothetical protein